MFRNYLKIAWRNLLRNKSYMVTNTLGLGVALACCITAYLLLAFNIEFDDFHDDKKVANVFKVHVHVNESEETISQNMLAPMPLGPRAAEELAGIKHYTRYILGYGSMSYGENAFWERPAFADSTFFEMFDYPLLYGSHEAFKNKYSIFLSEELARKYFGNEDPTGRLMVLYFKNSVQVEVIVGGVLKEFPDNNTFTPQALMRIEVFLNYNQLEIDNWDDWRTPATFFTLTSPENAENISGQLDRYVPLINEARKNRIIASFRLEHFKSGFTWDDIQGSYTNLRMGYSSLAIFSLMAMIILLIACFNLTNTSIAMTGKRLKEVGVRKVVGAARKQIVYQFLIETLVTITLALMAGMLIAQFIVPTFATMWELSYGLEDLSGMNLFLALLVMLFLSSLLAGIYPALFNSKFKPVALLKGTTRVKGTNPLTRSLVALQFALSVVVLIAGVVFIQNSKFQEGVRFGYDIDQVIAVRLNEEREFNVMENALGSNPKILSVSVSDGNLGSDSYVTPVRIDTSSYQVRAIGIGKNYFQTMGLDLAMGRTLGADNASDREEGVVVNDAFLEKTGIKDPIERIVTLNQRRRRIVGVVENHIDNLFRAREPEPFIFYLAPPAECRTMQVRTDPENIIEMQQYLEATWKEYFPDRPFESFLQDDLALGNMRATNTNLSKIFFFITVLGGFLSASGIFALTSLNINRRTKEIGIRKVLGATVNNIVMILNGEFVILLVVAGVIGSIGGYYLTDTLLNNMYAYRVPITPLTVVLCAFTIFGIGILTTSTKILKAARSNPVDTLRDE